MSPGISPIRAMVYRQFKRWLGARSRVAATILNPLLWAVFLGLGWGSVFSGQPAAPGLPPIPGISSIIQSYFSRLFGGVDYVTFMVSGMAPMAVFMGSFIGGLSVIWDKQFGYLKETLAAPASRRLIILGRILGDSLVNALQALAIVGFGFAIAGGLRPLGVLPALVYLFLESVAFSAAGTSIALKLGSMEGFQMIVNLIAMPLIFTSGVFYPYASMPDWMKAAAQANPLSYAVHAVRYWLTGADVGLYPMGPLTDLAVLGASALALVLLAGELFERSTVED